VYRILGSTPELIFAFWLAVVVSSLALVMLAVILIMRAVVVRRERRRARDAAYWRAILIEAAPAPRGGWPPLSAAGIPGFLEAWNDVNEDADKALQSRLVEIGQQVGLRDLALARRRGGFHDRAMAIIGLGFLRDPDTFDALAPFLDDKSPIVSLCAARALAQIDPKRAMSMFVPHILDREDWSQGSVARILKETGNGVAAAALSQAALRANEEMAPRLVRFLAAVSPQEANSVIHTILSAPAEDHLISACLQVMSQPADLALVRSLLGHPRWHVRMHAATALGRLGERGDEDLLVPLLADDQWWVRYRAAQGLIALPFIGRDGLQRIHLAQQDPYARDITGQVLAEWELSEESALEGSRRPAVAQLIPAST
jgi:HEAT repeat protein